MTVSVVIAAHAAEGPFSGTWEQACVGWGGGTLSETFGTVDQAPTPLVAIASMDGIDIPGSGGYTNIGFVIVAVGALDASRESFGSITLTTPGGEIVTLTPESAVFFGHCANTGTTNPTQYATWVWNSTLSGQEFVATETTIVDVEINIQLTAQAAGNAGSDVLLTWTVANCADTTFEIFEQGVSAPIATVTQPTNGYVVMHLNPDTEYTFSVEGDVNGASTPVTVTTGCRGTQIFNCDCAIEPTYQTLAQLRTRMMIRLGYPNQAANPPPGMASLVDAFLYDSQKLIWKQLSRAGLNVERFFRWIMVPGQRYYGIDQNADRCDLKLDPYKVVWVGFEDLNQAWYRLTEGVPPEYYTRANINFGWPTHYEIRSCIEIFPAPQAPYTLWIKGDFGLASFTADGDTATIDDEAVFLLALGMAKMHYGQKDAQSLMSQADTYIRGLVAGLHGTRRYVPRTKVQNPATPPRFLPLGDAQA